MKCKEDESEDESFKFESFNKLQVHIGNGQSTYMTADIMTVKTD